MRTCPIGEFLCSNNQCIPEAWLCDGARDCSNDEENCGMKFELQSTFFKLKWTIFSLFFILHNRLRRWRSWMNIEKEGCVFDTATPSSCCGAAVRGHRDSHRVGSHPRILAILLRQLTWCYCAFDVWHEFFLSTILRLVCKCFLFLLENSSVELWSYSLMN